MRSFLLPLLTFAALALSVSEVAQGSAAQSPRAGGNATFAQPQAPASGHKPADQIQALISDAGALPPELESDVLLQIVEDGLDSAQSAKQKLVVRAFERASAAEDDVGRRAWGSSTEETTDGLHALALMVTHLDRVSLQARAIRELASLNPNRAKAMFASMAAPRIEPLSCDANWRFVPDAYYETLGKIVESGFSAREVASGSRGTYVASIISSIHSHVQIVPAALFLSSSQFTKQELRELLPLYAAALRGLDGDPLSFSIEMSAPDIPFGAISKLAEQAGKQDLDSRVLIQALRDYLVQNFRQAQCSKPETVGGSNQALPDAVQQFNGRFSAELARAGLAPIGANEIRADVTGEGPAPSVPLQRWKSPTYFQFLLAVQKLDAYEAAHSAKNTDDGLWLAQASDLLTRAATWSDTGEPETEFFHQKALVLEALAKKTAGSSIHGEAMDALVRFLEQNAHQQVSPVDWFFHAKRLLSGPAGSADPTADLQEFLNSHEPMLNIYARLQLLQRKQASMPGRRVEVGGSK
jgi:hypothetical protein